MSIIHYLYSSYLCKLKSITIIESNLNILSPITHSLIHPFTHSFTHSFIHSFIHSLIHSFTHSFTHSLLEQSGIQAIWKKEHFPTKSFSFTALAMLDTKLQTTVLSRSSSSTPSKSPARVLHGILFTPSWLLSPKEPPYVWSTSLTTPCLPRRPMHILAELPAWNSTRTARAPCVREERTAWCMSGIFLAMEWV